VFRNSVRIDGINFYEVFSSRVEASDVEDRLVGRDVHHHRARVRLVHLQPFDFFLLMKALTNFNLPNLIKDLSFGCYKLKTL
jgi:hypothetical protein